MLELYHSATHFVFPSKCEGWGLPLLEAIACGLKVIATDFGGQSEFLKEIKDNAIPIAYRIQKIKCATWKKTYPHNDNEYGEWAYVDFEKMANKITSEIINYSITSSNITNSDAMIVRNNFSWRNSSDLLLNKINI